MTNSQPRQLKRLIRPWTLLKKIPYRRCSPKLNTWTKCCQNKAKGYHQSWFRTSLLAQRSSRPPRTRAIETLLQVDWFTRKSCSRRRTARPKHLRLLKRICLWIRRSRVEIIFWNSPDLLVAWVLSEQISKRKSRITTALFPKGSSRLQSRLRIRLAIINVIKLSLPIVKKAYKR